MSKGTSKDIYHKGPTAQIKSAKYWLSNKSKERKKNGKCNPSYIGVIDYNKITKTFLTYYLQMEMCGQKRSLLFR